jgi:hypothetical protein
VRRHAIRRLREIPVDPRGDLGAPRHARQQKGCAEPFAEEVHRQIDRIEVEVWERVVIEDVPVEGVRGELHALVQGQADMFRLAIAVEHLLRRRHGRNRLSKDDTARRPIFPVHRPSILYKEFGSGTCCRTNRARAIERSGFFSIGEASPGEIAPKGAISGTDRQSALPGRRSP